jgi:uncharacterized protein (DUF1697 family)
VRFVALLRGVNVGGKNLIKMTDVKACFEDHGFGDVTTYIQSGNVLFGSSETNVTELTRRIERMLSGTFDHYAATVVLRSQRQMRAIVDGAPRGFGQQPSAYRYDVIFLKAPLTSKTFMKSVTTREGVDEAHAGQGVLYFSRLTSRATQSYLGRIISLPMYQELTIRNWNTTGKLLALLDATTG